MDEFKQRVQAYCSLDDTMKETSKQQKELKKKHNELGQEIMEYMTSNKLEACNAGALGMITISKTKSTTSIKKDQIKHSVVDVLTNKKEWKTENKELLADELATYIMENRETKEGTKLKRKKVKG